MFSLWHRWQHFDFCVSIATTVPLWPVHSYQPQLQNHWQVKSKALIVSLLWHLSWETLAKEASSHFFKLMHWKKKKWAKPKIRGTLDKLRWQHIWVRAGSSGILGMQMVQKWSEEGQLVHWWQGYEYPRLTEKWTQHSFAEWLNTLQHRKCPKQLRGPIKEELKKDRLLFHHLASWVLC